MTLSEAIKRLEACGVDNPAYDARELFYRIGGVKKPIFLNTVCTSPELESAIERRVKREPLQYIIGSVGFYNEEYKVTPDCLIPRSDTEILVDLAVKRLPDGERMLDLCTGSGCVAISVMANTVDTSAVAVDISDGALSIAKENAKLNGVSERIEFVKGDCLSVMPVEVTKSEYF
jgi:HemK-like putative methylase